MNTKKKLMDDCNRIQHIGIPTDCLTETIGFYEDLGFERAFEIIIRGTQKVAFMKAEDIVLELYEDVVAGCSGAVNHFAINCSDIESAYQTAMERQYKIVSKGIEELPFWEHGVRFFMIEGPNQEHIEIDQRL